MKFERPLENAMMIYGSHKLPHSLYFLTDEVFYIYKLKNEIYKSK